MKLAFEAIGMSVYDDGTWIVPTNDGGIAGGGEWKVEDGTMFVKSDRHTFADEKWVKVGDELQRACNSYYERLSRAVAATIVGGSGSNY